MIGSKLGAYEITEEIGAGGMATVYRAYQPSMDRHVAIKLIRASILHDPSLRDRFRREARLIARLEHPHLLPVYDFDGDHDPPFIVMRYLEGGTLKQVLEHGDLPHDEVLYMLRQVASALDYAHRQGVVHRDLKPSNVMIDREGNGFVTDFGIARAADTKEDLTGTGILIGTPGYMSPEQARGESGVDKAADIYALGVMVFEILTGTQPYPYASNLEVIMAHVNDPVPSAKERRAALPEAVDAVIRTAMDKDRTGRFGSATELVAELTAALRVNSAAKPDRLQSMTQTISLDQLRAFENQSRRPTPTNTTPSDQQRQMTAIYLDVTELAELLYESGADPETVRNRLDGLWSKFEEIAADRGGVIQSRTDEIGVALWGRDRISEDDPERAIRASLRMRDAAAAATKTALGKDWEPSEESPLPFSAGITTGPVLLERETQSGAYTASGATITLAGRLKDSAPPGTILVAHDTFTQVRGVFSFHPHDPIRLRGRKEPLEVYLVSAAKPRAFRVKARGIEGIETRMIGREIELRLLQEALTLTLEDGETQVVTVVGEAGVGKSRLLFEFSNWTDLLDETVWFFQARATQPSMLQPYSLTRDLFSFRFQILDSDSLETVHDKFVDGVEGFLGGDSKVEAELIGQLVGFDFSDRPSVVEALKNADQFRTHALEYLGEFFTTASKMHPVVIHIEDIHWADDRSLDLINNLVRENTRLPLFVICMARPGLYERRPQWGEGQRFHERIQLEPLSQLSSRRLVKELLKKMPEIPSELRDLIVDRADGNPFYIEELIKALIDDGVIIKGEKAWGVDSTRLSTVRVPPTLTGVLQSRLDTLPTPLHQLLQRASVVGRMFWDAAAVHLSRDAGLSEDDLGSMLEDLREREMVLRREESSFAGTTEYVFRHAILRDVTYETIVPRHRRALHRLVGDWLLEMGGERAGEHTLLVAEHYTLAGEPALAAEHLRRAGEAATKVGAYEEALTTLHRALDLVRGEAHTKSRLSVQLVLGELHSRRGELPGAVAILEPMLSEARTLGDLSIVANVLGQLARISMWKDENEKAKQLLDEALPIVRQLDDQPALMFVLRQMGNLMLEDPEVSEPLQLESREIAKELGDVISEGQAVNGLGILAMVRGDYPRSLELFEESLGLFREAGDRSGESMLLGNIGDIQVVAGDFEAARRSLDESLAVARKIGDSGLEGNTLEVRARLFIDMGEDERAREDMRACLSICKEIDLKPMLLLAQGAVLEGRRGNHRRALEWVGFVRSRRAWGEERLQMEIDKRFDDIRGDLDEAEMAAALEHGATLDLDTVFARFHETYGTEDRAAAAPPDLSRPRP